MMKEEGGGGGEQRGWCSHDAGGQCKMQGGGRGGGGEERGVQMYIVPISCTIIMYKTANRTYNCLCNLSPSAKTAHHTVM